MALLSPDLQLVIFSGKGGVGKTTLSCGLTRALARAAPHRRILLISTDPAHSLGDVLGMAISDDPVSAPDLPNLHIRALDAEALLQQFKATYGSALQLIGERASWFEREDLLPIWDLAWPGVDELMAILEVNRLLAQGLVDTIVLDTAPTGHTLRLLELPAFLDNILAVFRSFQLKHQEISRALTGTYRPDVADEFLTRLQQELLGGKSRLSDSASTAAWLVMIPEHLSLAETERFCQALQQRQIPLAGIVINQVLAADRSGSDLYRARQAEQSRLLITLSQHLSDFPLWISPFQRQEPIGAAALDAMVQALQTLSQLSQDRLDPLGVGPLAFPSQPIDPDSCHTSCMKLPDLIQQGIKLALTGGKGGVGKTTVAGSLAWSLAKTHPHCRILVVSIDPAHSLGDLFEVPLGQEPTALLPNLMGQEIDAEVVLEQFRRDYLEQIVAILAGESTEVSVQYDPEAWRRLLEMPPPGLDEVMALLTVLEQMQAGDFDLVILDTAPTGHMLRFLQMPQALEGWVSLALKLWLKYRDVVGRPELAQRLRGLLQQVRGLRAQLQDPHFVVFIPVFNPEQTVLAETARLMQALDQLQIPHPYAVLNRIWQDRSDDFGKVLSDRHHQLHAQLQQTLPQQSIIKIPFIANPTLERISGYLNDQNGENR